MKINLFVLPSVICNLIVCLAIATALSSTVFAQASDKQSSNAKTIEAIRAVMDQQVAAWNRGDIEGFMDGYWRSPDTVFISGDSVTKGWQTVLDRYKKGYDSREKMGRLSFTDLEFNVLNKTTVIVIGHWELAREKDNPKGRFTLIFRKVKTGWRVVHDHTSSA
jgi:beta-aspartyl-peptidase (threonine type)